MLPPPPPPLPLLLLARLALDKRKIVLCLALCVKSQLHQSRHMHATTFRVNSLAKFFGDEDDDEDEDVDADKGEHIAFYNKK